MAPRRTAATKRRCRRLAPTGLALLLAPASAWPARSLEPGNQRGGPSVVLVTFDTLRADVLGTYGSEEGLSPHLDRFAGESLLFEQAYSTASRTGPAHASILSGQHPSMHGAIFNGIDGPAAIRPASVLLSQHLSAHGFETAAFVSGSPLRPQFGFARGFDDFRVILRQPPSQVDPEGTGLMDGVDHGAGRYVNRAVERWLEESRERRFFLWVHYFEAHLPYHCVPHVYEALGLEDRWVDLDAAREMAPALLRRYYGAEVYELDELFGELLDLLRAAGVYESAVILATSDHGEYLGEHGAYGHQLLYREVLHVPLMIRLPEAVAKGPERGRRIETPVSLIDVAPTLLAAAGVPPMATVQGRDLLAGAPTPSPSFSEWHDHAGYLGLREPLPGDLIVSVQEGAYKLILDLLFQSESELFDVVDDPREQTNVWRSSLPAHRTERRRLTQLLSRHFRDDLPKEARQLRRMKISDESREMLRALGYLN